VFRRLNYIKRILSLLQTKERSYDKTITTYQKRNEMTIVSGFCTAVNIFLFNSLFLAIVSVIAAKVCDD